MLKDIHFGNKISNLYIVAGLCKDGPEPCVTGTKFADASSCHHYYECTEAGSLERKSCPAPTFVFDISVSQCVLPNADFDCGYRCPGQDGK